MEKEETLFALRAPEIDQAADETQTVVSDGGELLIKIRSRKQKIVNGKVVETTTPSCKVTMGESWLSSRVEVDNQYNILDVYFDIEKEADPQLIDYSYSPQSDSQYIYDVTVL